MARAATLVSVATLVSRLLGVVREMVMARYFGAGLFTDAFNIAYRIPNLLRDLFAEGALSSAFVPTFVRYFREDGGAKAWQLANYVINALLVILGVITLVIVAGAKWFVYLLAAGFADIPEKLELTILMTRIMSPFLLFVALAAVVMGMLNARGSFFVPALAPSSFNVWCILAGIFLSPVMPRFGMEPIVSMAIGAVVGGATQFIVQLPAAYRLGFRYRLRFDPHDPGLRHIAHLMLPAVIGLSATQINVTVDNHLASRFGNGPVSWLNYAFRLMQLPIGLFGVAIATATLAEVSHHAARNQIGKLRDTVASSLRLAACLTFPATVGLILFREPIIQLLYERGSFLASDTLQTGRVLLYYALALFAYSGVKILVPTFYALDDTRTPLRTSVLTVAVKVVINFLLIVRMQFVGLALATSIAAWLNFAMLLRSLIRRTEAPLRWSSVFVYLRISAASLLMGFLAHLTFEACSYLLPSEGLLPLAAKLAATIAIGIASMFPLLRMFGVPEVDQLSNMLRQIMRRSRK